MSVIQSHSDDNQKSSLVTAMFNLTTNVSIYNTVNTITSIVTLPSISGTFIVPNGRGI